MITEAEKLEILNELEKRMDERAKEFPAKKYPGLVLKEPREKWFSGKADGCSLMTKAIGNGVIAWKAWDAIRKLTCIVCGAQTVKQLERWNEGAETAEKICQFIYDLMMEDKEDKKNGKV